MSILTFCIAQGKKEGKSFPEYRYLSPENLITFLLVSSTN